MPNFEPLQNSIPIAPLKLASLEGCRDFANLVDKHLSDFRHENPSHTKDSIAYRGYLEDSYLIDCRCPRFGFRRSQRNPETIRKRRGSFYPCRCAATTASLTRSAVTKTICLRTTTIRI